MGTGGKLRSRQLPEQEPQCRALGVSLRAAPGGGWAGQGIEVNSEVNSGEFMLVGRILARGAVRKQPENVPVFIAAVYLFPHLCPSLTNTVPYQTTLSRFPQLNHRPAVQRTYMAFKTHSARK